MASNAHAVVGFLEDQVVISDARRAGIAFLAAFAADSLALRTRRPLLAALAAGAVAPVATGAAESTIRPALSRRAGWPRDAHRAGFADGSGRTYRARWADGSSLAARAGIALLRRADELAQRGELAPAAQWFPD